MKLSLLLALMLLLPMQAHSFYKCIDKAGGVTYQKIPCSHTSAQNKMHVFVAPAPDVALGNEVPDDELEGSEPTLSIKDELAAILASLTPVKGAVADYYKSNNQWPEHLADVGMNEAEMSSSYIDSVSLAGNGRVLARLKRGFGTNKKLIIEPRSVMGGTSFEWKCFANFPAKVLASENKPWCSSRAIN